jgi:hypothetical protein
VVTLTTTGILGDIVQSVQDGSLDRKHLQLVRNGHSQGQTQERKDYLDGERDALRTLAGMDPLWDLNRAVTPAYQDGWAMAAALDKEKE